jgi:hypothetical protein
MFAISAFIARAITRAHHLLRDAERVELEPINTKPAQIERTADDGVTIRASKRIGRPPRVPAHTMSRALRLYRDGELTAAEAAELAGVTPRYFARVAKGERRPELTA